MKQIAIIAGACLLGWCGSQAQFIYVSNAGPGADTGIQKFDLVTGANLGTFAGADLGGLTGIAFDSNGNLYAASRVTDTIEKFSPQGADLGAFVSAGLSFPIGLAFDTSGNLYVSNIGTDTIEEFSSTGVHVTFATNLSGPVGLAFDSKGSLFVANNSDNTIREFGPDGKDRGTFANTGLNAPLGLAFDNSGNLFAANGDNTIEKFNPAGKGVTFATGLSTPRGLAFDAIGNLYVVNSTYIEKFDPTGKDLGHFITTGLNNPEFLAVSAVPQPGGTVKIQSLAISGKKLNLTVETTNCGATLTVQQTSRLVGPEWSDVSEVTFSPCQVGVSTATFAVPSTSPEFYRVVLK